MGGAAVRPVRHSARAAASLRFSHCAAPSLRDLSGRLLRRRRQSLVGFHSARSLLRHARGVALVRGDARACRRLSSRGALDRAGILGLYRRAAQYQVFGCCISSDGISPFWSRRCCLAAPAASVCRFTRRSERSRRGRFSAERRAFTHSRSIRSSHRPALRSTSFSRCCSYGA